MPCSPDLKMLPILLMSLSISTSIVGHSIGADLTFPGFVLDVVQDGQLAASLPDNMLEWKYFIALSALYFYDTGAHLLRNYSDRKS